MLSPKLHKCANGSAAINIVKTYLKKAQNLSLCKGISSLAHFLLWLLHGADLFLSLDFEFAYCYCLVAP